MGRGGGGALRKEACDLAWEGLRSQQKAGNRGQQSSQGSTVFPGPNLPQTPALCPSRQTEPAFQKDNTGTRGQMRVPRPSTFIPDTLAWLRALNRVTSRLYRRMGWWGGLRSRQLWVNSNVAPTGMGPHKSPDYCGLSFFPCDKQSF